MDDRLTQLRAALPVDVLTMLAPVADAMKATVRDQTRETMLGVIRDAQRRVRGASAERSRGKFNIDPDRLATAVLQSTAGLLSPCDDSADSGTVDWGESEDDSCPTGCQGDSDCHGDCDCAACEDECSCREYATCCGWCSHHGQHCDDDSSEYVCPCGCNYCRNCDHTCNDR